MCEIRVVRPEDAPALADLFRHIDTTYFRPHPMTVDGAIEVAEHVGADVYLVGWDGDVPVAYGMLRGWDEGFPTPSLGIAVRDGHQGQGHGRAMMQRLHEIAFTRAASVRLRVSPENRRARSLYESLGYVDVGEDRGERLMLLSWVCP